MSKTEILSAQKIEDLPYCNGIDKVCDYLKTDIISGLSSAEVNRRLQYYGSNQLEKGRTRSHFSIFLDQLLDPMIYILLIATLLAIIFEEWLEAIAILVVILITTTIGYIMETQAIKSMEALRKLSRTKSKVIRDGALTVTESENLVPGDILYLEEGDVIPVDGRIFECISLGVKEDALTGESGQVAKTDRLLEPAQEITDQLNMVFAGTLVSRGKAKVIITNTGRNTILGQINSLSQKTISTSTPLDKKLLRLNRNLINICLALVAIVLIMGLSQGKELWLMIETSIALAVAAIPEGLPIVATVALARGMLKLAKKNVIIKKMEAVQTLGEMGVILTDKTGTLTENKMAVHTIALNNLYLKNYTNKNNEDLTNHPDYMKLRQTAILCNNANFERNSGDPLELALYHFFIKTDPVFKQFNKRFKRVGELPFDANTRMMATAHKDESDFIISAKGASEKILSICDFPSHGYSKHYWHELADQMANNGLRILAFATKRCSSKPVDLQNESHLDFVGIIGFLDTPRSDVSEVIDTYQRAGIKVIMVTGDHPNTAKKVADEIGLFDNMSNPDDMVIKGPEIPDFAKITEEMRKRLLKSVVFARVLPQQKLQIVDFFQKNNFIVGMTGDGVNDAPALKKSDVGIAMGIRGTEAAKEVADIILKDDKFTSIYQAIFQGRTIFENIRKFVVYLMSSNFAEIAVVAFASISNLPQPLLPLQILFLNLVTDVFPALALSTNEVDSRIMDQPPRSADEPIMTRYHWTVTGIYGFSIAVWVTAMNIYASLFLQLDAQVINNLSFYTLVLSQLLNLFNLPKAGVSPLNNEVTKNPWIWIAILISLLVMAFAQIIPVAAEVLSLVTLSPDHYLLITLFAFASLIFSQLLKNILRL